MIWAQSFFKNINRSAKSIKCVLRGTFCRCCWQCDPVELNEGKWLRGFKSLIPSGVTKTKSLSTTLRQFRPKHPTHATYYIWRGSGWVGMRIPTNAQGFLKQNEPGALIFLEMKTTNSAAPFRVAYRSVIIWWWLSSPSIFKNKTGDRLNYYAPLQSRRCLCINDDKVPQCFYVFLFWIKDF